MATAASPPILLEAPPPQWPAPLLSQSSLLSQSPLLSQLLSSLILKSVFASKETRRNTAQNVETKSAATGIVRQDTSDAATPRTRRNDFWISVPTRSAPSSPFGSPFGSPTKSPKNTKNDDFVPYYYVTPKPNQFWSAPEMPTSTGQPPAAFFDSATSPGGRTSTSQQNPKDSCFMGNHYMLLLLRGKRTEKHSCSSSICAQQIAEFGSLVACGMNPENKDIPRSTCFRLLLHFRIIIELFYTSFSRLLED